MKRNKGKGFTLIELLAVIVILAIIALITVPIILNVIYKAEKGAFEDTAYGVIDAGRLHFTESLADTSSFAGKTFDFGTKEHGLKISGEKPGGGTLVLDAGGSQALAIYDGKKRWCAYKEYKEEKITIKEYEEGCGKVTPPLPTLPSVAASYIINKNIDGNNDGLFTDDYGNVRYRGKAAKNYINFNNSVWRIIGVFDGRLKLRKDVSNKRIVWDTRGTNQWIGSNAQLYVTGEFYNTITPTNQDMIDTLSYYHSAVSITSRAIYSKGIYPLERKSSPWLSKVALAYPSDYGYAAGTGCTSDLYNYGACAGDNWMYRTNSYQAFINPDTYSAWNPIIGSYGNVAGVPSTNAQEMYPVIHLKSLTEMVAGDGTSANPYTLR